MIRSSIAILTLTLDQVYLFILIKKPLKYNGGFDWGIHTLRLRFSCAAYSEIDREMGCLAGEKSGSKQTSELQASYSL